MGTASTFSWVALILGCLILGVFSARIFIPLGSGHPEHWDASLTAERAREFLVTDAVFTVHQNFEPTSAKPPLHYWLTAASLKLFEDPEFAIRFWSALFGVACIVMLMWLTACAVPGMSIAGPVAGLFLTMHIGFFVYSSQALLDSGSAFFLLLTMLGCEKARGDPRWWWLAVAGCVLGSIHKLVFGFLYLVIFAWITWLNCDDRWRFLRGIKLPGGVALVGVCLWPAFQLLNRGSIYGHHYVGEYTGRFEESSPSVFLDHWEFYLTWFFKDWQWIGIAGLLAVCATLLVRPKQLSNTVLACAVYVLALLVVLCTMDQESRRWLFTAIPATALVLTASLAMISRSKVLIFLSLVSLLLVASADNLTRIAKWSHKESPNQVIISKRLGETLEADERIFVVLPNKYREFRWPKVLFYGDLQMPAHLVWIHSPRRWPNPRSLMGFRARGIAREDALSVLEKLFSNLTVVERHGAYVLFRADAYINKPTR